MANHANKECMDEVHKACEHQHDHHGHQHNHSHDHHHSHDHDHSHGHQHGSSNEWEMTAEDYDKRAKDFGYNGPQIAVRRFLELNLPKDSHIVDVGAGTGVIGQLLAANGYTNVDALDGSPKMLEIAKQRNCYKNIITSFVASDIRLPIEDDSYDVAIMAGVFCPRPGHIQADALEQIMRVIKPDGVICWAMGVHENYSDNNEQILDNQFSKHVQALVDQGKWTHISPFPQRDVHFQGDKDGLFYAMKVL